MPWFPSSPPGCLPTAASAVPLGLGLGLGQAVSLRGWLQACVPLLPAADVRDGKDERGDSLSLSLKGEEVEWPDGKRESPGLQETSERRQRLTWGELLECRS